MKKLKTKLKRWWNSKRDKKMERLKAENKRLRAELSRESQRVSYWVTKWEALKDKIQTIQFLLLLFTGCQSWTPGEQLNVPEPAPGFVVAP